MQPMKRFGIALAAVAVATLGVAALVQAHRHPVEGLGGGGSAALALALAAGLGAFAAGVQLRRPALAAAGPALFLAELPQPQSGGALLFTAALALGATAPALAGTAALAYPRLARAAPDGAVAGAALGATALWLGILPTATFDPRASGCFECPRNLLLIGGNGGLHDALVSSGLWASAAACAALALLALVRAATRRSAAPLVPAAVAAGLGAAGFAVSAGQGAPTVDATTRALWLVQCGALALAAAGVAFEVARNRRLARRIAGLVLSALPSAEALRATLGAGLGDPELAIVFPRTGRAAVDIDGRPAPAPARDRRVTEVTRGGNVIAELRHGGDAPERVAEAARGAGLALEHASLRARLRAELADLAVSRARVIEVGDAERRRLERNLHDGAQQRLIALSVALQQVPSAPAGVVRAREEVALALDELRALAHGIHPAALSDAGLDAAVRDLIDGARVPARLESLPAGRLPAAVESAAYRLVLDAVACAERAGDGRALRIAMGLEAGMLRARLVLPGVAPAAAAATLEHADDRFAALAGELAVIKHEDGAAVEASVPCGS